MDPPTIPRRARPGVGFPVVPLILVEILGTAAKQFFLFMV